MGNILRKAYGFTFIIMLVLAFTWVFQANRLSQVSEDLSDAQQRMVQLKRIEIAEINDFKDIEQIADSLAFEKIETVQYIEGSGSTALLK